MSYKQEVVGSSPAAPTKAHDPERLRSASIACVGRVSLPRSYALVFNDVDACRDVGSEVVMPAVGGICARDQARFLRPSTISTSRNVSRRAKLPALRCRPAEPCSLGARRQPRSTRSSCCDPRRRRGSQTWSRSDTSDAGVALRVLPWRGARHGVRSRDHSQLRAAGAGLRRRPSRELRRVRLPRPCSSSTSTTSTRRTPARSNGT